MNMYTFEQRLDTIVTHAWETWTNNGLGLDSEEREETAKTVKDAAASAYLDNMTDIAWLDATLARLIPQGM
jgi:hypothetical protein